MQHQWVVVVLPQTWRERPHKTINSIHGTPLSLMIMSIICKSSLHYILTAQQVGCILYQELLLQIFFGILQFVAVHGVHFYRFQN